jgi:hypothetical protein
MITCNLTKPESTLDQVRKSFPNLRATDAALIATALVMSGRYALAVYDGKQHRWPEDYASLINALMGELHQIQASSDAPVKKTKAAPEEEAVEVKVGLIPSFAAGERMLGDKEELKTLLGEIIQKGVEYVYSPNDIGWQWCLDRANWSTLSEGDLTRRVKLKAVFEGGAAGVEVGAGAPKKRAARAPKAPIEIDEAADLPAEADVADDDA